jgi:hypothetical protein
MSIWIRSQNRILEVDEITAVVIGDYNYIQIQGFHEHYDSSIRHTINYEFDNETEAEEHIPKLLDLISEAIEHSKVINLEKIEKKFLKEIPPKPLTHTPKKEK